MLLGFGATKPQNRRMKRKHSLVREHLTLRAYLSVIFQLEFPV